MLLALIFAPSASASKTVVGFLGGTSTSSGNTGGLFNTPRGVAVNETGAGPADPGDIYVVDGNNHRIQQFSEDGEFIRAWGWDVIIATGPPPNSNGTAYEVCDTTTGNVPSDCKNGSNTAAGAAGGGMNTPHGIAINPENGHVYVTVQNFIRVNEYTATGEFVRAWGQDVVSSGPGDAPATSEVQTLTVDAEEGTFTLTFEGQTTGDLAFNATAEQVQTVLQELSTIGSGHATVTGGPGAGGGGIPYVITFSGALANVPLPLLNAADGSIPLGGGASSAEVVETTNGSSGFEICEAAVDTCKTGVAGATAGAFASQFTGHPTVAPEGTANAGNVLVADPINRRIQEFTDTGQFVRALGWDVSRAGVFGNDPRNEVQEVAVTATAGTFTLTFGGNTTPSLPFDATDAQVESALEGLGSVGVGNVAVAGGPGDKAGSSPYEVEFIGTLADTDVAQMTVGTSALRTEAGNTLSCIAGANNGSNDIKQIKYQWLRDGAEISGATGSEYTTVAADTGKAVQCRVFVQSQTFSGGNPNQPDIQVSNPASVVYPHPGPEPPTAPNQINAPTADSNIDFGGLGGQTLTCNPGSWTDADSFSYRWYRSGVPLSGTNSTYMLSAADVATFAVFQCAVTGHNAGGSVVKASQPTSFSTEAEASVPNTLAVVSTPTAGANFEECAAHNCKVGVVGTEPGQFSSFQPTRVKMDGTGAIYTVENSGNFRVQKLTPQAGPPPYSAAVFAPSLLSGSQQFGQLVNAPMDVAIIDGERPVVSKMTPAGATPVCPDGNPSVNEARLFELEDDGSSLLDTHIACSAIVTNSPGQNNQSTLAANRESDVLYLSTNGKGHRVFIIDDATAPVAALGTISPTAVGATVTGTIDPTGVGYPNPPATTHHVEYKLASESNWTRFGAEKLAGNGTEPVPFTTTIVGLEPNSDYEVRIVATKEYGSAQHISAPQSFKTQTAPPAIGSFSSSHVTATSADLHAVIDPQGSATTYRFEYGTTSALGSSAPIPDGNIASGNIGVPVTVHLEGLQSVTYHFRVVAESAAGTTTSTIQTFTFYAPNCPNTLVRQQTASNYLPDCRAYEIASAPESGSTVLYPSGGVGSNSGQATSPSRLGYMASFGGIPGTGTPINSIGDFYVATRNSTGWKTNYVGRKPTESAFTGPRPGLEAAGLQGHLDKSQRDVITNPEMSRFVLWDNGNPELNPNPYQSNAPYIFDPEGNVVDRWPTNLGSVPGGEAFKGEMRFSEDLSHFVFSSDIPFLEGAPAGAVYDNDTVNRTLEVISFDAANEPIQAQPLEVSDDGSNILMTTGLITSGCNFSCPPLIDGALYMRIGSVTHDVSQGNPVEFAGMSDDGSRVYFTSLEPLTGDDTDTSSDLFMWDESAPTTITRVSVGVGGAGNTDDCEPIPVPATPTGSSNPDPKAAAHPTAFRANWVPKCGAIAISELEKNCPEGEYCDTYPRFFSFHAVTGSGMGGNGLSDNFVAAESGDIYFYSPEQLSGPDEGAGDQQNLFLYRNGDVQFVAALETETSCKGPTYFTTYCSKGTIARMQVSPDGRYAAFVTRSRLTSYDNAGWAMMYVYDADTGALRCGSCATSGEPPTDDVQASQNGLFMTDDGRAFFSTVDPLVPQDTNEGTDVYEYVEGRPQLISQGTGVINEGNPILASAQAGLVGVSANGVDAYFSTFDVLTPYDHNGGKLKVYNARTNGGFPFAEPAPGCVAADECHGDTTPAPPAMLEGTGAHLGAGGNVAQRVKKRRAQKKKRRAAQRRKAQRRRQAQRRRARAKKRRARRSAQSRRGINR